MAVDPWCRTAGEYRTLARADRRGTRTYRRYQYNISAVVTVWKACNTQIGPIGRCRTYTV
jgi:hypothetical protein